MREVWRSWEEILVGDEGNGEGGSWVIEVRKGGI
jgi:hypothetical protein